MLMERLKLIWLNYLSNILYLSSIGFIGLFMLLHCNKEFPKALWKNKLGLFLITIPFIIEILMIISAPFTGFIFYVDVNGYYHRSATFIFQLIPYLYLIETTVFGVYWYFKSDTTIQKNKSLSLSLFAIPPFILGGIQVFMKANELDLLEFSFAISLIANFAVTQDIRITRDPLTKLPNRIVFDNILSEKMKNDRKGEENNLYLLMGDLDDFKSINDKFGHLEGDRALLITADILNSVCTLYKFTASRFGVDEFAMIVEGASDDVPKMIINEIDEKFAAASINEKFDIKMSIGYAKFRSSDTINDLTKAADRELYKIKNKRKALV